MFLSILAGSTQLSLCPKPETSLPISRSRICRANRGTAYRLSEIDSRFLRFEIPGGMQETFEPGSRVVLEFILDRFAFEAETVVNRIGDHGEVFLDKPASFERRRVRRTVRTDIHTPMHYTLWTEVGRFQAELLDISEDGMRMLAYRDLKRGELISLDFYLSEPGIRVSCQGTVKWCREDGRKLFETGVQFVTIPDDVRRQLGRYAQEHPTPANA